MRFYEKLASAMESNDSLLCVGLDSDVSKLPAGLERSPAGVLEFNERIVEATLGLVCAYKPNAAFYESLGDEGWSVLRRTIELIPNDIPVIVDAKRGDIGNTAKAYAKAIFEGLGADAVTLNPYLGGDSIDPFTSYQDKGAFVLCRTSNKSAGELQDLGGESPLYLAVARRVVEWNGAGNLGVVAGATYPDELKKIRGIVGEEVPILIPGVGSQAGDLGLAVKNGTNSEGSMAIINSSRGIIFADASERFADGAREAAERTRKEINAHRR